MGGNRTGRRIRAGGADRWAVDEGELRLLSAWEVLQARREGALLAQDGRERALCDNACLLARALESRGRPVSADGQQVLSSPRVAAVVRPAQAWDQFNRSRNPSPWHSTAALDEATNRSRPPLTTAFNAVGPACSPRLRRRPRPAR
mgnify:CR=1 FL=1